MKQTLITLLALAGVAAAETLTFEVVRDTNAITFEFAEVTAQEIMTLTYTNWTYRGGGDNNVGSWQTPKNEAYQNSFSPDAQLRDSTQGETLPDSWTMNFTVTNNSGADITLTGFTFDTYGYFGGGEDRGTIAKVTLTLNNVTTELFELGKQGATTTATLTLTGDNAITIGAKDSVNLALTMNGADPYNTYTGITAGSVTYAIVPEPATATLSLLALAGLAARRRRR
ncbi:MAG: PEP-CTERM sorting domain-containing protein [Akkermansia sp.]|nr:PEP-CTERM sorting domain-containing protein [Akkermansia sp.]